jgi:hypothetical protein
MSAGCDVGYSLRAKREAFEDEVLKGDGHSRVNNASMKGGRLDCAPRIYGGINYGDWERRLDFGWDKKVVGISVLDEQQY